jgi:hypothetical protein
VPCLTPEPELTCTQRRRRPSSRPPAKALRLHGDHPHLRRGARSVRDDRRPGHGYC